MVDIETIIIGAGIHGTCIAHLLNKSNIEVSLIDTHGCFLVEWKKNTSVLGMSHLRSPYAHNIANNHIELLQHSLKRGEQIGDRPSLEAFNSHCKKLVEGLENIFPGRVHEITRNGCTSGWKVNYTNNHSKKTMTTKNVVLAIGSSGNLNIPEWALDMQNSNLPVYHIFSPEFSLENLPQETENVLVIGGGISAGQLALKLSGNYNVTIQTRKEFEQRNFDASRGYLGPTYLTPFRKLPYEERRKVIVDARRGGTIPKYVMNSLRKRIDNCNIQHIITDKTPFSENDKLILENQEYDAIILATGYSKSRPGGKLVDKLVKSNKIMVTRDGDLVVEKGKVYSETGEVIQGLYVTGALAQIYYGPFSGNIWGAQRAGEDILEDINGNYT